jgi:cell division septum initiation protein DivIVA
MDASGAAVLITVHVLNKTPPLSEAARLVERAEQHAQSVFQQSAEKHGHAAASAARQTLESGDVLLSSVVNASDGSHLLQFALVSPTANLAIITVEGNGFSAETIDAFQSKARSARFAA